MTQPQAFGKLDDVRDEYDAARLTLGRALREHQNNTGQVEAANQEQITLHHLEACVGNLPITYLLRMFAEFEGILRDYRRTGRGRTTTPRMRDLMNGIAAYCIMSQDDLDDAHEVREYRNDVIHQHAQDPRFDFQTCRSRLARYIRWLPRQW